MGILSNAFAKSRYATSITLPTSTFSYTSSRNYNKFVSARSPIDESMLTCAYRAAFRQVSSYNVPRVQALVAEVVIVIVIFKLLKRRSKEKSRAPAYSRTLRKIRGYVVQRMVRGRLRYGCRG